METTIEYRMEPKLRRVQSAVYLLAALAPMPMLLAARSDRLLPLLVWAGFVVLIAILIVGVNRAKVKLGPTHLTVVGALGTRTLERDRVRGITVSSGSAILAWRTTQGRERAWPLMFLYLPGAFATLLPGAEQRRQQFIDRVNAWAASGSPAERA